MYAYMKGVVTQVTPYFIILEVQNIGYQIYVPNPFYFKVSESYTIYMYYYVREDAQLLYGFSQAKEREIFEYLLSVSGIGPKNALALIAAGDLIGLVQAIQMEDTTYLMKFPGVGKKTAQRLVFELKDKFQEILIEEKQIEKQDTLLHKDKTIGFIEETCLALSALGYKDKEIQKVKKLLMKEDLETTDAYLRFALMILSRG